MFTSDYGCVAELTLPSGVTSTLPVVTGHQNTLAIDARTLLAALTSPLVRASALTNLILDTQVLACTGSRKKADCQNS